MSRAISIAARVLFICAVVIVVLAVWQKLAMAMGYTLRGMSYSPGRLLEFSAILLLFVIALEIREIKKSLEAKKTV